MATLGPEGVVESLQKLIELAQEQLKTEKELHRGERYRLERRIANLRNEVRRLNKKTEKKDVPPNPNGGWNGRVRHGQTGSQDNSRRRRDSSGVRSVSSGSNG
jgi:hypothetical protein